VVYHKLNKGGVEKVGQTGKKSHIEQCKQEPRVKNQESRQKE
jgi:hypothetical protein